MPLRKLLLPLSFLYGMMMWLRNLAYDYGFKKVYQAEVPVISVGNISTGGTGKTPVSEYLLSFCQAHHISAAYLSRGYGRKSRGYFRVPYNATDVSLFGDEAIQVARRFPEMAVAVSEDRPKGIRNLMAEIQPQLIILDDAFQHRKVHRDLDLLVVDANRLPSRDFVLPAGNLREFRRGIQRADLLIVNKIRDSQQMPAVRRAMVRYQKPLAFCRPVHQGIFRWDDSQLYTPDQFSDLNAIVFSGIGNNVFFLKQLKAAGIRMLEARAFRDHYQYSEGDIQELIQLYGLYKAEAPLILTTEKDMCRMRGMLANSPYSEYPFAYLPIQLEWLEGEQLVQSLLMNLNKEGENDES